MVSVVVYSEDNDFVERIRKIDGYILSKKYSDMTERDFINRDKDILIIDATSDTFSPDSIKTLKFNPAYQILVTNHPNQQLVNEMEYSISDVWYLPLNPAIVKKRLHIAKIAIDANAYNLEYTGYISSLTRTPQASVKGYADVMLMGMTGELTEQQTNFIKTIQVNAKRLQNIIDSLRDESLIKLNRFHLEVEEVSTKDILDSVVKQINSELSQSLTTIEYSISENAQLLIVDRMRLEQIMIEIIERMRTSQTNISIYKNTNGVIQFDIHAIHTNPQINYKRKLDEYYFGFPHIFTIVEHIIKAHGGEMWLEQNEDSSTFHFTIPIAQEDSSDD